MSLPGLGRAPRLSHEHLLADVRRAFAPSVPGDGGLRLGLEIEAIPILESGARVPVDGPEGPSGRSLLDAAAADDWTRDATAPGGIGWRVPQVGLISFEPGGQLELSTRPYGSVDALVEDAEAVLRRVRRAGEELGIRLVTRGMDPEGSVDQVELSLDAERYRRQRAHYDAVGPWGRRMMLQSAAIHVNADLGGRPIRRWVVANRAAAEFTAIFANSPRYEGRDTGFRSIRAEQWRHLDPSRTGVFAGPGDPAEAYLAFALDARDFLATAPGRPAPPFRAAWEAGADHDAWRAHLTTLFPEVRPRGYLELRSFDTQRPAWMVVPLVLVAGLMYDPEALEEAEGLLGPADAGRLSAAGREGLADAGLASRGLELFDIALEAAGRLGPERVGGRALEVAGEFRARFTARGRDPGHEKDPVDPFEV